MTTQNVELIKPIYGALNRRDWEAAFRDADPNCEFTIQWGPNAGTHRGREAVQRRFEDLASAFDSFVIEPEEFYERGSQVVVFVNLRGRPRGTHAEVENRIAHLWTIRDGKVRTLRGLEREDALEAAGLLH